MFRALLQGSTRAAVSRPILSRRAPPSTASSLASVPAEHLLTRAQPRLFGPAPPTDFSASCPAFAHVSRPITASVSSRDTVRRFFSKKPTVTTSLGHSAPTAAVSAGAPNGSAAASTDATSAAAFLASFSLDEEEEALLASSALPSAEERAATKRLQKRLAQYDESLAAEYVEELASHDASPAELLKRAQRQAAATSTGAATAVPTVTAAVLSKAGVGVGMGIGAGKSALADVGTVTVLDIPPQHAAAPQSKTDAAAKTAAADGNQQHQQQNEASASAAAAGAPQTAEGLFGMSSLGDYSVHFPDPLIYTGTLDHPLQNQQPHKDMTKL